MEALVNNAGIYGGQGSLDHKILDVNLIGMVHGTKLAREKMSVENGGLDILYMDIQNCQAQGHL